MNYIDRKEIYEKIEKITKRPLITYVTTIRQGIEVQMALDVLPEFINQINKIDKNEEEVNLLLLSNGGDPIVALRIISLLRERFKKVYVLIPYVAFSSATLLALGADGIIMHPYGNLGPIDPQVTINEASGKHKVVNYMDLLKYTEFLKDAGIKDEKLLSSALEKLTDEISPSLIGVIKRSSSLGLDLGTKLLSTHMKDKEKIKKISETLNTKFYHHGYPLSRKEAIDIGLPIISPEEELEELMWELCQSFLKELKFNKPFNPDSLITESILNRKVELGKLNIMRISEKIACVESINQSSSISNEIIANYTLYPDGKLNKNIIVNPGYWKKD